MESRHQTRLPTPRRTRTGDEGQAVVEAAIVLPAMLVLVVCTIQLAMLHHARIMTEYAAYSAARAGIVFNGDRNAMTRAAELVLLPTVARTDTFTSLGLAATALETTERAARAPFNLPFVRVTTLNPTSAMFTSTLTRHTGGDEIDFDDVRAAAARANLLSVKVRYLYRMPVPFANQMLLNIFFASRLNILQNWAGYDMSRPELGTGGANAVGATTALATGRAASIAAPGTPPEDVQDIVGIARAALVNRFYFPLEATYTMRMQSNLLIGNVP